MNVNRALSPQFVLPAQAGIHWWAVKPVCHSVDEVRSCMEDNKPTTSAEVTSVSCLPGSSQELLGAKGQSGHGRRTSAPDLGNDKQGQMAGMIRMSASLREAAA